MDYIVGFDTGSQLANYGSLNLEPPDVTIAAGQSATVQFSISPPSHITQAAYPVFGGFISITDTDGERLSVPYIGPPYSLYNSPYIEITTGTVALPRVQAFLPNGSIAVDSEILSIVPSYGYGIAMQVLGYSEVFRIDMLPANTSITAEHYGFSDRLGNNNNNNTVPSTSPSLEQYVYVPSNRTPSSVRFGYPSFGALFAQEGDGASGYVAPNGWSERWTSTAVTGDDGVRYEVGDGDYRWFASVLRWGGERDRTEDYDTWLGPVVRFVDP